MNFNKIDLNIDNSIAVITLNDPSVRNAISDEMLEELMIAIDMVENSDKHSRCVVITGAGKGFCSGANVAGSSSTTSPAGSFDAGSILETGYHPLLRRLRNLPVPLVTAVNGAAAGVGMSIALMGDLIIASRSARFIQAFGGIGLIPDGGSTWMLPRLIGIARARELSLLGEKLTAEKALDWGLINRVYDDEKLMDSALTIAHKLASGPTVALGLTRKAYWASLSNSYEEQLDLERTLQRTAGNAEDFKEGVLAFLQKRPADFQGR